LRQLGAHLDDSARLRAEWMANVEAPLAAHVAPLGYELGQLRLGAATPAWASRARMQQTTIMKQLRKRPFFRELRGIKIRVQPVGESSPGVASAKSGVGASRVSRLSPSVAAFVRDVAGEITDPSLRAALERLARDAANKSPGTK